jgi:hypothetical protein
MSNALLARYFHERGLFAEFDFAGMKEGNVEPLFEVWLQLPVRNATPWKQSFGKFLK